MSYRLPALATLLFSLTLCACAPMYNTDYTFVPPKSEVAKMCTVQCQSSRESCFRDESRQLSTCEAIAGNDDAKRHACSNSGYGCQGNYINCYQACGGTVNAIQRCVAFCDQEKKQ